MVPFKRSGGPLLAVVGLDAQRVTIYDSSGRVLQQSPVSTGNTGYETPAGIFSVVQSTRHEAYGLAVVQLATVSIVCTLIGATNGFVLPSTTSTWVAVVFLAVFATAIAFFVQTWAQAHLSATRTAVVMTMEPVFATLFAVLFADEQLTLRIVVGAAFVLGAMYLVELGPRHAADSTIERLEV